MTTRRRSSGKRPPKRPVVARAAFPALVAFFSGYFHEDLLPEHGSGDAAARAFRADASPEERQAVDDELRRFLALIDGWPMPDVAEALTRLGAAWRPDSVAEIVRLLPASSGPHD